MKSVALTGLAMLALLLGVASIAVLTATGGQLDPLMAAYVLLLLAFPSLGWIIARQRPGDPFGWIFLAIGLGLSVGMAGSAYLQLSMASGPLPLADWAGLLPEWLIVGTIEAGVISLLLLYPTGTLPSPRWRPFAYAAFTVVAVYTVANALSVEEIGNPPRLLPSPTLALPAAIRTVASVVGAIGTPASLLMALLGVAAIWGRFRRSHGAERQQLKWLAYVAIPMVIGFALAPPYPLPGWGVIGDIGWTVGILGLAAIPLATGVAILRHGLWEIDRIISRTVSYGLLTAVLAVAYILGFLGLQAILAPFVEAGGPTAVALSVLVVFAIFQPARRRIQAWVERRFDRSRYDAANIADGFSLRLRDRVDLDTVRTELAATTRSALRPASVGVWLRSSERRS